MGDRESWNLFGKGEGVQVRENLGKGRKIMQEQGIQGNWGKIEKSNYNKGYKGWKKEVGCEKYLLDRNTDGRTKEQWVRIRYGNLRKGKK